MGGTEVGRRVPWRVICGLVAGAIAVFVLLPLLTPQYVKDAKQTRAACRSLAAPEQGAECDRQYDEAIAKGRAETAK